MFVCFLALFSANGHFLLPFPVVVVLLSAGGEMHPYLNEHLPSISSSLPFLPFGPFPCPKREILEDRTGMRVIVTVTCVLSRKESLKFLPLFHMKQRKRPERFLSPKEKGGSSSTLVVFVKFLSLSLIFHLLREDECR